MSKTTDEIPTWRSGINSEHKSHTSHIRKRSRDLDKCSRWLREDMEPPRHQSCAQRRWKKVRKKDDLRSRKLTEREDVKKIHLTLISPTRMRLYKSLK